MTKTTRPAALTKARSPRGRPSEKNDLLEYLEDIAGSEPEPGDLLQDLDWCDSEELLITVHWTFSTAAMGVFTVGDWLLFKEWDGAVARHVLLAVAKQGELGAKDAMIRAVMENNGKALVGNELISAPPTDGLTIKTESLDRASLLLKLFEAADRDFGHGWQESCCRALEQQNAWDLDEPPEDRELIAAYLKACELH